MFRAIHRPSSGAQNCNCSLWFYVCFWMPAAAMAQPSQWPATKNVRKTGGCNYSFELLMVGGVSPETCWAIKKHWNNKFYYTAASCWFFLWDSQSHTIKNLYPNVLELLLYIWTVWISKLHSDDWISWLSQYFPTVYSPCLTLYRRSADCFI